MYFGETVIILIFNQSADKKSAQKPYKAIFNSYELLFDFFYTFSLKISIKNNGLNKKIIR